MAVKEKMWCDFKSKYVEQPQDVIDFFKDLEELYKKHNLSISHQDHHGAFELERFNSDKIGEYNLKWIKQAHKAFNN